MAKALTLESPDRGHRRDTQRTTLPDSETKNLQILQDAGWKVVGEEEVKEAEGDTAASIQTELKAEGVEVGPVTAVPATDVPTKDKK